MAIPELDLILNDLVKDPSFLGSKSNDREKIINANIIAFNQRNPGSDLTQAQDSGKIFNQRIRKELGEGRKQVDPGLAVQELYRNLPEDFQDLSKDDQIDHIKELRGKIEDIASQDYLNPEDVEFQLNSILNQTERKIIGDETGVIGDKFARIADGLINAAVSPFDSDLAQKLNRELFPENPKFDESFWSKLSFGAGDFAGQTAMFLVTAPFLTPAGSTAALFGANASRKFQDNYRTAIDLGLDEDAAMSAGLYSIPGAVIDSLGDRLIIGKFLPTNAGSKFIKTLKATPMPQKAEVLKNGLKEGISTGFFKRGLRDAFAEGASEAAGDFASGYGGYLATGYREFIPSSEELRDSFAIGAILGGGAAVAAAPFGGRGAIKDLESRVGEIDSLTEAARNDFISKFESNDMQGAIGVLQNYKKQKERNERNQNNVDAKRKQIQEVSDSNQEQRGTGQSQTIEEGDLAKRSTSPLNGTEGENEQLQRAGSLQSSELTNQLVRSIAGDRSVDEELDRQLPQRAVIRQQILGAKKKGILDQDRKDALTLFDTAVVKASQEAGIDPAVSYNALNSGKGFRVATSKKEAKTLRKEGYSVMGLYRDSDATTVHHELSHVVRKSGILRAAIGEDLYSNLEQEYGVDGDWTIEQEERYSSEFEQYLKSGQAKSPFLKQVFDRVKEVFRKIYLSLAGTDVKLSDSTIKALNELYNIDTSAVQDAIKFVDNELNTPATVEELQSLESALIERFQNQTTTSDEVTAANEKERATLFSQAFDEEIENWYHAKAEELGVSPSKDQVNIVVDKINEAFGSKVPRSRANTEAIGAFIKNQKAFEFQKDVEQSRLDENARLRARISARAGNPETGTIVDADGNPIQQDTRGDISGIGNIFENAEAEAAPATNQPTPTTVTNQPTPTIKNPSVNYEGKADVANGLSFIRNNINKLPTSEDKELAGLLQYLGRSLNIALGRGLLRESDINSIINGIKNFRKSRNKRARSAIENRLPTREEIEEMTIIKASFDSSYALSLLEDFEPILGAFPGTDRSNLDEVVAWVYKHAPLEEAKGEGSVISDEMKEKLDNTTNQLVTKYESPEAWMSDWESLEGPIDNQFGARDHLVNLVSNVFGHLSSVDLDSMTHRDAIVNFMSADALLNTQTPGIIAKIGDAAYREDMVNGARERSGTWAEKWFNPVSKQLSVPIERTNTQLDRVSRFTETQQFFQNEVFGPFDEAVSRMSNAYRKNLDRYLEAQKAHFDNLGFKDNDKRTANEHLHLTVAMRIVQVEIGSNSNQSIKDNFDQFDKSIANQRSRSQTSDHEVADALESAIENLKALVDLDSPTLYQDLNEAIPQFLNYDQAGQDAVDSRTKYLDDIRSIFADLRSGLKFVTEAFRGPFQDFIDYAPTSTVEVVPGKGAGDITASGLEGDADAKYFKSTKKQTSEVKRRTGLSGERFYDLNMDRYIPRQILGVLFETYTTGQRFDLASLYKKDSEFSKIVTDGKGDKRAFLERVVIQQAENTLNRAQSSPAIVRQLNAVKGQLVKIHLGSIGKLITEPAASLSHYFIRRGGKKGFNTFSNFIQGLSLMAKYPSRFNDFLKTYNRDLYDRSAGEVELDKREFSKMVSKLPSWMRKIDNITQHLLLPIRIGDGFAARSIFAAEYIRLLKSTGQATSHLDVDLDKPDFKLINQANRFTEEFVGLSGQERRGFFFSDRDPKLAVTRNLLFSYQHHLSQLGQQLQRDVRDIAWLTKSGRPELSIDKVRDAAGIIGQIAVFSAFRFLTIAGMTIITNNLIKELFDDEEGKLAQLQKNIDEAETEEDKILAQQEYTQARIVRDFLNKSKRRTQNPESLFKSIIRDELSGVHIIAGFGNGLLPKVLTEVPDHNFREAHNEAINAHVREMQEEIKDLRKKGDDDGARKMMEEMENLKDQEYLTLFYDFPSQSGIPGIYGSVIDTLIDPVQDGINIGASVFDAEMQPFNFTDAYLHLQLMGVGQSDINRYVKQVNRIERDRWKQQRDFERRRKNKPKKEGTSSVGPILIPNL